MTTMTGIPTMASVGQQAFTEIDAGAARRMLAGGECVLIDVREADEHAAERIDGAVLLPLSTLKVEQMARLVPAGKHVIVHCKGGKRSAEACRLAAELSLRGVRMYSLAGGIEAWKRLGQPVTRGAIRTGISVMRQVQMTIGALALGGSALAWFVHPGFVGVPAFLGCGLIFAGATGTCALATVMSKMPWNRSRVSGSCSM
ncbi:MAG TPA: rhodanese-like domain-containing protein [Phycisphaerales bacterium]|nr:rhodanese-like domain-containing protein [Phycisphaerales bacterium]